MTQLLLAEDLFLLTHDEKSGRASAIPALDSGLAGALLLDLADQGLLVMDGKKLRAVAGQPSHPLLAAAHGELLTAEKLKSARHWVSRLPAALKPLGTRVGQSLSERGVLRAEHAKVLGIFPTTKWPEVDPTVERQLRDQLTSVLVAGTSPDPHLALLIAILSPLGMVRGLVDKEHRKTAQGRAKRISDAGSTGAAVSAAVASSVQAVQAAVITAVIIPTVVSTGS